MKISNYKHPTRQDFPGLSPEQERAMESMGRQIRELTQVLQGKASLTENANNEIKTLTITDGVEYQVTMNTMKGDPIGAIPIYSSVFEVPRLSHFEKLSEKRAKVKFSFSSPPADPATVRILFIGA